jgi:hypothetical protein
MTVPECWQKVCLPAADVKDMKGIEDSDGNIPGMAAADLSIPC